MHYKALQKVERYMARCSCLVKVGEQLIIDQAAGEYFTGLVLL